jgi:histidine triad (HIT) family protein
MEKCIFCEIMAKRVPAAVIYEDDEFVALLDINPLNPGHTLVVPKAHVRWTFDVDKFGDYWEVAKAVALAAMEALDAFTVNFLTIGFGEMSVEHAHINVVPRFKDDGQPSLPDRMNIKKIPKEEMAQIAEKLKAAMANHPPKKLTAKIVGRVEEVEQVKEEPAEKRSKDDVAEIRREMESG